jgi:7-cyano-7-deazaguanine synthase
MKAMVVLSGGQDSTTCLYWALDQGWEVHAVTFNYGQRHARELEAAALIAGMAGIRAKHEIVDVGPILKGTSPLVSDAKLEQYKDQHSLPGGLEKTFVPMRNQLFLTLAANRAYVSGINHLVTGVCQEDFGGYPDCRREFINAMERASSLGTFTGDPDTLPYLSIHTPLMDLTKAKSVELAINLPGCYKALAYSHTSYDGQYPPTGHDHATLLRAKGFEEAGVPDPLVLRAWGEGLMALPDADNYRTEAIRKFVSMLED